MVKFSAAQHLWVVLIDPENQTRCNFIKTVFAEACLLFLMMITL